MPKKMTKTMVLNQAIANNAPTAIVKEMYGNTGYSGAVNGRSRFGSERRSFNKLSMAMMYINKAPNTDMVMMLAVKGWPPMTIKLSLKMASMPMTPPKMTARCGVLKRWFTLEKYVGM